MIDTNETLPLVRSNSKLGEDIWQFSLPADETCPGATPTCRASCYALRGYYRMSSVRNRLMINDAVRRQPDFVARVVGQIAAHRIETVRIHASGDFDLVGYVRRWRRIAEQRPRTRFYFYTRSWVRRRLLPDLVKLGRLSNVTPWWSCDRDTPRPPRRKGFYVAYMAVDDEDQPRYRVNDLIFRVDRPTHQLAWPDGTKVCPAERQQNRQPHKVTCSTCRICFDRPDWARQAKAGALPVLSGVT